MRFIFRRALRIRTLQIDLLKTYLEQSAYGQSDRVNFAWTCYPIFLKKFSYSLFVPASDGISLQINDGKVGESRWLLKTTARLWHLCMKLYAYSSHLPSGIGSSRVIEVQLWCSICRESSKHAADTERTNTWCSRLLWKEAQHNTN